MATSVARFSTLTARDLMTGTVESIPQEMSLRAAAHLLSQARISGAPVVDELGRCVGVLSASDFVHLAEQGDRAGASGPSSTCVCSDWQVMDVDRLARDQVRWHMSARPITVSPGTRIAELARRMTEARVHRLIVVDALGRPIGIVSGTDIVKAVGVMDYRDGAYRSGDTGHDG
jgi:CBS domain-containing protein